jgi:hypothetical protein
LAIIEASMFVTSFSRPSLTAIDVALQNTKAGQERKK